MRLTTARFLASGSNAPSAKHAAGVALLLNGVVDAALTQLEEAARANADANVWNDYAVALLVAAEQRGTISPVLDSMAASAEALRIEANHSAAKFNRALALERLGLEDEALRIWSGWREQSPWRDEVTAAAQRLTAERGPAEPWADSVALLSRSSMDEATVRRIVQAAPRDARTWAEAVFTAQWAEAIVKGDAVSAAQALNVARAIGSALLATSGETLIADSIRIIDGTRDPKRCAALARAYLTYRDGRLAHRNAEPMKAERLLRSAADQFERGSSPMQFVARYFVASALHAQERLPEAAALLDTLAAAQFERRGYYALAGQIGWERGLCLLSQGSYSAALDTFERSRECFSALGETSMMAAFDEFTAATFDFIGDPERAWQSRSRALRVYARLGERERSVTALESATRSMLVRREWARAMPLLNLAAESSHELRDSVRNTEALLQRAAVHTAFGDLKAARSDIAAARISMASIPDLGARQTFTRDILQAEASAVEAVAPAKAIILLEKAEEIARQSGRFLFAAPIVLQRGRIRRRIGDVQGARNDFHAALDMIERQRTNVLDLEQRALQLSAGKELFSEAISLALENKWDEEAFALTERSRARALLDRTGQRSGAVVETLSRRDISSALASDAAVVEYVITDNRLTAFVLTSQSFRVLRLAPESSWSTHVAPLLAHLRGTRRLAIVLDPAMSSRTFAALRDPVRGHTLIDQFTLLFAPSASIAITNSRRARQEERTTVLAIAATRFDGARYGSSRPLPFAEQEIQHVASLYTDVIRLSGATATPDRVRREMSSASIIHFAGHGIARPFRPGDSLLVLAPGDGEEITASAISRLDLRHAKLVFLSACRGGAPRGAADGVQSLATAFLAAGAHAVVAATVDIGDEAAADFARRFHDRFHRDSDAAEAFRDAARAVPNSAESMNLIGGSPMLVQPEGRKR